MGMFKSVLMAVDELVAMAEQVGSPETEIGGPA